MATDNMHLPLSTAAGDGGAVGFLKQGFILLPKADFLGLCCLLKKRYWNTALGKKRVPVEFKPFKSSWLFFFFCVCNP
jgi:hypothetical protein